MTHFTVAASERTFTKLFEKVRDNVSESTSGSHDLGAFSVSYNAGFHLEGGSLNLNNNGTVEVSELDIVYDPLDINFGIDLPKICVGGWCILPTPWGCAIRLPRICVFSSNPDIILPIDIGGLVESEISGAFALKLQHYVDPARTPGMTDLDAELAGIPNLLRVFLDPVWLDIDLIDISDTIGNILDAAIDNVVDGLLGWLPRWARDLIKAILGPIVDLIRFILDIGDDIDEWLSSLLGTSLGLLDFALTYVADYFAQKYPVYWIENPYPILEAENSLIPVKIPLESPNVQVNNNEFILTCDIGA